MNELVGRISNLGRTSRPSERFRRLGRAIIGYLVLPNLAFALIGHFVYMTRPVINIDYLLLGVVAGFLPPQVITAAYMVLLANDAFLSLAPVFHFGTDTAVFSISFALMQGVVPWALVIGIVGGISALALICQKIAGRPDQRRLHTELLLVAGLVIALDVIGGTNALSGTDAARLHVNVATSGMYKTGTSLGRMITGRNHNKTLSGVNSATGDLMRSARAGDLQEKQNYDDIVLILVESLGHLVDVHGDSEVLKPLLSDKVRSRYSVRFGTIHTHGATTNGELRELCGVDADYRDVSHIPFDRCLPALLRKNGFSTESIHGYSGGFFDRYEWYPRLGFQRIRFAEDLKSGLKMCGSTFRGVCDRDIAPIVKNDIENTRKGERQFLYWVTLTSHLPVDEASAAGSTLRCDDLAEGREFADVCALMQIQRIVVENVATMAVEVKPSTRFILVGDHPPPFFSREKRSLYSPDEAPFVELIPR